MIASRAFLKHSTGKDYSVLSFSLSLFPFLFPFGLFVCSRFVLSTPQNKDTRILLIAQTQNTLRFQINGYSIQRFGFDSNSDSHTFSEPLHYGLPRGRGAAGDRAQPQKRSQRGNGLQRTARAHVSHRLDVIARVPMCDVGLDRAGAASSGLARVSQLAHGRPLQLRQPHREAR